MFIYSFVYLFNYLFNYVFILLSYSGPESRHILDKVIGYFYYLQRSYYHFY